MTQSSKRSTSCRLGHRREPARIDLAGQVDAGVELAVQRRLLGGVANGLGEALALEAQQLLARAELEVVARAVQLHRCRELAGAGEAGEHAISTL